MSPLAPPKVDPIAVQVYKLMTALEQVSEEKRSDPEYKTKVLQWVKDVAPANRPPELYKVLARVFNGDEASLRAELDPRQAKSSFEPLVPKRGWLRDYIDLTNGIEPPTVFHFFAGAVAIGAAMTRNVYFPKGANTIYPNLAVVIVAPSGKCRKTTACNVATSMLQRIGHPVLADKITPEAFIEAFRDSTSATGLIYAPELAVFLGKQKYQEGMIPMLTALFDCPAVWKSATIMRGEAELRNVAISMLGCSTLDWIQSAIPKDAFGGGFMSRLLFVVQEDTPRRFPLPAPLSETKIVELTRQLREFSKRTGEFRFSDAATKWYTDWYIQRSERNTENRQFAGYFERKPDQLIRLAMILSISGGKESTFDVDTLEYALRILDWLEQYLPSTFDQMQESTNGADQMALINQLKRRQGGEQHSVLLRLNHRKMNAQQFRQCMQTLRESGMVEYNPTSRMYYLTPEGYKA
jgi:hypothetical protein